MRPYTSLRRFSPTRSRPRYIQVCNDHLSSLVRLKEGRARKTKRVSGEVWTHPGTSSKSVPTQSPGKPPTCHRRGCPLTIPFAVAKVSVRRHITREWVKCTRHSRDVSAAHSHLGHDKCDVIRLGRVRLVAGAVSTGGNARPWRGSGPDTRRRQALVPPDRPRGRRAVQRLPARGTTLTDGRTQPFTRSSPICAG